MAETIALVGGETMLGRDVIEVFGECSLGPELKLVASEEEATGKIALVGESPAVVSRLEAEEIEDAAIVILAGSKASSQAALDANPAGLVIDLTYFTEDDASSELRSPLAESGDFRPDATGPRMAAHPAATVIALILNRLQSRSPIARAIVHVFEPASERGKAGIDELQRQTVNLFAFQPLPKTVFDAQLSFNMLAQWGEEASHGSLLRVEERIEKHLASLLSRMENVPMPSLRVVQAPVFHGYTFSFWVDFETDVTQGDIEDALRSDPIDLRSEDVDAPSNVGMAGQSGIAAGGIRPDANSANAYWIWAAADNLRIMAESAALLARESR